jgi:putative transposase
MSHSFTNLLYHMVFSTKDRGPWIKDDLKDRLWPYLGGVFRGLDGIALCVGGTADHTHLLVKLPATLSVADVLRDLKANSSGWVHKEWTNRAGFAWQIGYGAFTVSQSRVPSLKRYIENQEEHHRTMTFQEEFTALLKKHGISYDERYIWE